MERRATADESYDISIHAVAIFRLEGYLVSDLSISQALITFANCFCRNATKSFDLAKRSIGRPFLEE